MHQQRGGGEAIVVIVEAAGMLAAFGEVGHQFRSESNMDAFFPEPRPHGKQLS